MFLSFFPTKHALIVRRSYSLREPQGQLTSPILSLRGLETRELAMTTLRNAVRNQNAFASSRARNKPRGAVRDARIVPIQTRASRDEIDIETRTASGSLSSMSDRCDSGDPDFDLCAVSFDGDTLDTLDKLDESTTFQAQDTRNDTIVKERTVAAAAATDDSPTTVSSSITKSAISEAYERGKWLVGLLILQSSSSFVLDKYQDLIREHLVVTLFLTMLVGAGGNAGNQSAIKVIRGMATGTILPTLDSLRKVMKQQITVAFILGTSLSAAGWVRVYVTNGSALNSSAIAFSLFLIVCTSVIVGTLLPFGLAKAGQDPANAGTSIQVLMDVLGVLITCVSCHFILDSLLL